MIARDYFAQKERCIYRDVLRQELRQGKRLVAENEDFVAFAPFASRFPFELVVIPKEHSSAFSQMSQGQVESLSRILRDGVAGRVYPGRISYKVDPPSAALSSRLACATATVPGLPPSSFHTIPGRARQYQHVADHELQSILPPAQYLKPHLFHSEYPQCRKKIVTHVTDFTIFPGLGYLGR